MNTTKRFALSAAAVMGLSAPAFAADVVYQEPPAPAPIIESAPVSSWAGPYAGVHLGYGFGGSVHDKTVNNDIDTSGWLGGVFGGFNMQNGQFVYGGEADVNYSGVDGSNAGQDARTRLDGSLRARAGVAVNDDILVYGTAGVAAERLRVSVPGASDTNMMLGYTVGVGTDVKLTEDVFARGEYRYSDYGTKTFDFGGVSDRIDSSNHRVTVGLGIKF
ncbi:MAG: porin family protein [Aquamicrobium sp.]|uniref:outer membrane protein n=1 Tax=Aquamicrobium sp. TaxID=1872579 RepID=UPI00349EB8AD|nr:porin family protein [Aquamicrobium sp.]MCO5157071.1 porin family protein [Aquamicrobium sp.]